MSFSFKWPRFSDQFHKDAIQLLNNALNKGTTPPVIADKIEVVELEMGTQPPELEIRDIGDLTMTQFRGIFRLTYSGDAHIVLKTKVQANPLYHKKPDIHLMGGSKGMVAANQPLIVPMLLRLSNFKLSSYVVLVVSKPKGITLVFKTDPLQNVDINSTFDSFTVIQKFIQKEIESQLRQMFREDLPSIIHRLSQQWIKKSTTVEAPYLAKRPVVYRRPGIETMSNPDYGRASSLPSSSFNPLIARRGSLSVQGRPLTSRSASSRPSLSDLRASSEIPQSTYDQETGTFKTEIPERRAFSHLGRIHRESRGLADLAEDEVVSEFGESDGGGSFDVVDWDDTMTDVAPPRSEMSVELESIPAVGGGFITRPRIYHASSLLHQNPSQSPTYARDSASTGFASPAMPRLSQSFADVRQPPPLGPYGNYPSLPISRRTSWDTQSAQDGSQLTSPTQFQSPEVPRIRRTFVEDEVDEYPNGAESPSFTRQQRQSAMGQSSVSSIPSSSTTVQTDTTLPPFASTSRRSSISSQVPPFSAFSNPPYSDGSDAEGEHTIVLRPGFNNAVSQLSLLNRSNHTLSPYTRPLSHFMIRSVPPKSMLARQRSQQQQQVQGTAPGTTEHKPVKAKRKRTWRLGGGNTTQKLGDDENHRNTDHSHTQSEMGRTQPEDGSKPFPPDSCSSAASDFDVSEIDRYFRSRDRDENSSPRIRTPNLSNLTPTSLSLEPHPQTLTTPPQQLLYPAYLRQRLPSSSLSSSSTQQSIQRKL